MRLAAVAARQPVQHRGVGRPSLAELPGLSKRCDRSLSRKRREDTSSCTHTRTAGDLAHAKCSFLRAVPEAAQGSGQKDRLISLTQEGSVQKSCSPRREALG